MRLNKRNRPLISEYITRRFDAMSNGGRISLKDIWDTQFDIQRKYGLSDPASQIITWEVYRAHK
jgi:hypothetical protein